jgi:hypothetical protein
MDSDYPLVSSNSSCSKNLDVSLSGKTSVVCVSLLVTKNLGLGCISRMDRGIGTPLKSGDELGYSGRVISSYSTNGTRRVNLVIHPVISHE